MLRWLKKLFGGASEPKPDSVASQSSKPPLDVGVVDELGQSTIDNSSTGFNESLAIGYLANDALLGGVVAGNLIGGMIGEVLNTDEHSKSADAASHFDAGEAEGHREFDSTSDGVGSAGFDAASDVGGPGE